MYVENDGTIVLVHRGSPGFPGKWNAWRFLNVNKFSTERLENGRGVVIGVINEIE